MGPIFVINFTLCRQRDEASQGLSYNRARAARDDIKSGTERELR